MIEEKMRSGLNNNSSGNGGRNFVRLTLFFLMRIATETSHVAAGTLGGFTETSHEKPAKSSKKW